MEPAIIFFQAGIFDQSLRGTFSPSTGTIRIIRRNDERKAPVNVQTTEGKFGAAVIQAGLFLLLNLKDLRSNSSIALFRASLG